MKFRKTKLTALAMSVLMAASTITSVTWAADLFTDGAPAEVVSEFVSEPEATAVDAEGESLLQERLLLKKGDTLIAAIGFKTQNDKIVGTYKEWKVKDVTGDTYTWENNKPDEQTAEAKLVEGSKVDATCTKAAKALYQFTVKDSLGEHTYISDTAYVYHDPDGTERIQMPTGEVDEDGYLTVPGEENKKLGHKMTFGTYTIPSNCERIGYEITYPYCSRCGVYDAENNGTDTFEKTLIKKVSSAKTIEDVLKTLTSKMTVDDLLSGLNITKNEISISPSAHSTKLVDMTGDSTTDLANIKKVCNKAPSNTIDISKYGPVNVKFDADGKPVATVNGGGYYYQAEVCTVCGNVSFKKVDVGGSSSEPTPTPGTGEGQVQTVKKDSVKFHYDKSGKVVVDYIFIMERTDGGKPTEIEYKDQAVEVVKSVAATCLQPAKAIYSFVAKDGKTYISGTDNVADECKTFTIDGKTYPIDDVDKGYIKSDEKGTTLGGVYGHRKKEATEVVVSAATCTAVGVKANYEQCADCHMIYTSKDGYKKAPTATELKNGAEKGYLDLDSDDVPDVLYTPIAMNDHAYDIDHAKTVTTAYIASHQKFDTLLKPLAPVNCYWEDNDKNEAVDLPNGKMVARNDKQDAYYYTVYECKYCGRPVQAEKVYLKDVNGALDGTYYEPVTNIQGFLWVDPSTGMLGIKYGNVRKDDVLHDAKGEPYPVMEKGGCTKVGYYKVTVYESDVPGKPVSSVMKKVSGAHTWGSAEVAPLNTKIDAAGTLSKTEDSKLLKADGKFVVVRDAQGNVTEAKSINCVTKAKYQLYHVCLACGAVEKVGDLKTTTANSDIHQWGMWKAAEEADSEYVNRGDYHEKYTYLNRTCDLCGERDLKLDKKVKESHALVETKVKDGEEKEPTCGESGYYTVQLQCPCGYADANTVRKTSIPATDKHDFGDNEVELVVNGSIQVGGRTATEKESGDPTHIIYGTVVRKCKVCGKYDSNGIDNTIAGQTGILTASGTKLSYNGGTVVVDKIGSPAEEKTLSNYVAAKADPTTKVPYPCSVGKITVTLKWSGKVDGSPKTLEKEVTVPYYPTEATYAGARAHEPGEEKIEKRVEATTTTPGSYEKVIYCRVCGDEISREKIVLDPTVQVTTPEVLSAVSAGYNSITVTWAPVANADSYELWYRGGEATRWTLIRKNITATSFTHTSKKLVSGVAYRYTVKAVKGDVKSDYSRKGKVGRPAPVAPVVKSVAFSGSKATVTWNKVAGANGYIIQRKTTGGWTRVGTVKSGSKVTWTDKKAVSGAAYRVRAYRTVENVNVYGPFSAAK